MHLPVAVAIANTAHPLDPAPEFGVGPVEILAWPAGAELAALGADLASTEPEYQRAFLNSEDAWFAAHPLEENR